MSEEIIIRVQTQDGLKRINVSKNASLKELYDIVYKSLNLLDYGFSLFTDRKFSNEVRSTQSSTINKTNLNHGDILYYKQMAGTSSTDPEPSSSSDSNQGISKQRHKSSTVAEDPVDIELSKLDGRIQRKRDEKLCRHTATNRCVHCSSLEPYDENYLKEQKIKHLSFHSYIRKMTSGVDRGKFVAFEDINCKIKSGCREHPPWPKGICSKCQPSAITLNRQIYRHVDNVMFENNEIVDEFINYWRTTSHQRLGFLYGCYETTTDVPLGIRARVVAIYEPPQESTKSSIKLLDDPNDGEVEEMATALGLRRIGWIFTDLEAINDGKVKHLRGIDTFFLTAKECILAGHFQNLHPNVCRQSSNGYLGSKFVTICVTGDKENQIHMEGYQVSAQCMALVRDNCLVPTKDAPELGYIRESTDKQYVPDVFFKDKDQYGNEVQKMARPLPVEYLLLDVPTSSPLVPLFTFPSRQQRFPIENRLLDKHLQDYATFHNYMQIYKSRDFLLAMSDFHVLLYLYGSTCFDIKMKSQMGEILQAVRAQDENLASQFMRSDIWRTFEQLISAHVHENDNHMNAETSNAGTDWTCNHCTFINNNDTQTCEMCSLPR
ncbi:unnamed protein product [Chironomus riparius]|uniref:Nuclear protein localization protein 4 homolog n=1 Tax=Chironomus riparius TaxID=315576 RepID=A0A9N9RS77_9DIPT|nr:unnamed protein product [Chironomus riparius]